MRKWPLIFLIVFMMNDVHALKIKSVVDNETASAKISSTDITRIFVQGDRIKSVRGLKGAYTRENDEKNGEIYIQPTSLYKERAFTILIETELGRHFTLLLSPTFSPSETLMLVAKGVGHKRASHFEKANPYELTIHHLIRDMKSGEMPEGYFIRQMDNKQSYQLGKKFKIKLKTIYEGLNLGGEIFEIQNMQGRVLTLDERQFYKNGVRAISLDSTVIPAKAKINLYRVVSHVR